VTRILQRILVGLFAIVALASVIGLFLPSSAHIDRSITINVPQESVFTIVNGFRTFDRWSPWHAIDPEANTTFKGPNFGVGATMLWQGERMGSGSQEIIASEPPRLVRTALDFGPQGTAEATLELEPAAGGTTVTWSLDTDFGMDLIDRYFGLFFDSLVGDMYDQGLANLKAYAEGLAPPEVVREFPQRQVTGVAVSSTGRVFVNFPLWGGVHDVSVVELTGGGMVPYPSESWNDWSLERPERPDRRFVCVQSVFVDSDDVLWILDPASPGFAGVVEGGAKLVAVDLATDEVSRVYRFDSEAAPPASYLNDIRVDVESHTAYITDSGLGALVILDLESGAARRVLEDHPAMHAEPDVVPIVGGRELRLPNGAVPQVHSDGIALDTATGTLYVHALTGRRLWSIPTRALDDPALDDNTLAQHLVDHGETVATDGMIVDPSGAVLHSAIELDAIALWRPSGELDFVAIDAMLSWPDSFALSTDGWLYVTTSRIHEAEMFGGSRSEPYGVLRFKHEPDPVAATPEQE
jgi:sugar lactone lactonase YvrE